MTRKLIDMARTAPEIKEASMPMPYESTYDYGLHLCFSDETLEKLNLDDDVEVGDMLDLRALAKVTSVSKLDTGDGQKTRVELTLTHIGVGDSTEG